MIDMLLDISADEQTLFLLVQILVIPHIIEWIDWIRQREEECGVDGYGRKDIISKYKHADLPINQYQLTFKCAVINKTFTSMLCWRGSRDGKLSYSKSNINNMYTYVPSLHLQTHDIYIRLQYSEEYIRLKNDV